MKAFEGEVPRLVDLHDRVAARPNIRAYLASERRIEFNEQGIFRRYKDTEDRASVIARSEATRQSSCCSDQASWIASLRSQ